MSSGRLLSSSHQLKLTLRLLSEDFGRKEHLGSAAESIIAMRLLSSREQVASASRRLNLITSHALVTATKVIVLCCTMIKFTQSQTQGRERIPQCLHPIFGGYSYQSKLRHHCDPVNILSQSRHSCQPHQHPIYKTTSTIWKFTKLKTTSNTFPCQVQNSISQHSRLAVTPDSSKPSVNHHTIDDRPQGP